MRFENYSKDICQFLIIDKNSKSDKMWNPKIWATPYNAYLRKIARIKKALYLELLLEFTKSSELLFRSRFQSAFRIFDICDRIL